MNILIIGASRGLGFGVFAWNRDKLSIESKRVGKAIPPEGGDVVQAVLHLEIKERHCSARSRI
jgi:hypothetical protein